MDFIDLIFRDYDIRTFHTIMKIAYPTGIISFLIMSFMAILSKHKRIFTICAAAIAIATLILSVSFTQYGNKEYRQYAEEGERYLSQALEESYGISLAYDNIRHLSKDIYYGIRSNEDITNDERIIYGPMQATTDQGTLITITFVREGEKLTVYKGTVEDMVLMTKKDKS